MDSSNSPKELSLNVTQLATHLSKVLNHSVEKNVVINVTNRGEVTHRIVPVERRRTPDSSLFSDLETSLWGDLL